MINENIIHTLSDWQIGTLVGYFHFYALPEENPRKIEIRHIALDSDGRMLVGYIQNGQLKTHATTREPNEDKMPTL